MANSLNYLNDTWTQAYNSVIWFTQQPFTNNAEVLLQAANLYQSFQAGSANITALQMISAFQSESLLLQQIEALPLSIGGAVSALTTRVSELNDLSTGLSGILAEIPVSSASDLLTAGLPSLTQGDYTTFLNTYSGDTYFSGISGNIQDWQTIQSALITYYGNNPTNLLDIAGYTLTASMAQSGLLALGGVGAVPIGYSFTQVYSLPVCLSQAAFAASDFSNYTNQQALVIKNALQALSQNISQTLLAAMAPSPQAQVNTTYIFGNESLQDVANRTLGNFERWEEIANINNILPGTQLSPGTPLILPPTSLVSGASGFSYNVNVLGQDVYIGPTSGSMPPWTGDFVTVSGPNNLIYALARRLLTTLGTFIYHPDYGCRIPPEVGAVQSVGTLQHTVAFGKSCLLSDPRVATIISASASGSQIPGLIQFTATIQAIGPQSIPVIVNEVIKP